MNFPKFIVEDDCLILAKCTYHKQLARDKENVVGGGWFEYDSENNVFILSKTSGDFGKAKFEDIKKCIDLGNMFFNSRRTRRIKKTTKFLYDTGSTKIKLN